MSRRRRRRVPHRRAFATLTAIGLIVVVGVALTALTALLARDVKRSLRASDDAQLRQLLTAGEAAARASLDRPEQLDGSVALPGELASSGFTLRVGRQQPADGANDDGARFLVTAGNGDGRTMAQSLRYARAGDRWALVSAERE